MPQRLEPDPNEKADQTRCRLLTASADHGITLATLALNEDHSLDAIIQNIADAATAYGSVLQLMPSVRMDATSQGELNARLKQLRSSLMQLGCEVAESATGAMTNQI